MQKLFRGYIQRKFNRLHGPAYMKRSLCVNDTDFFTLDPLNEIDKYQFISFEDKDNFESINYFQQLAKKNKMRC